MQSCDSFSKRIPLAFKFGKLPRERLWLLFFRGHPFVRELHLSSSDMFEIRLTDFDTLLDDGGFVGFWIVLQELLECGNPLSVEILGLLLVWIQLEFCQS